MSVRFGVPNGFTAFTAHAMKLACSSLEGGYRRANSPEAAYREFDDSFDALRGRQTFTTIDAKTGPRAGAKAAVTQSGTAIPLSTV